MTWRPPLDALGIEPPTSSKGVAQSPIEGVSLAQTFADAGAKSNHVVQYFEMMSHRSIMWNPTCPCRKATIDCATNSR